MSVCTHIHTYTHSLLWELLFFLWKPSATGESFCLHFKTSHTSENTAFFSCRYLIEPAQRHADFKHAVYPCFPSILLQRLALKNIIYFEDLEKRKAPLLHLCTDFTCNWTNTAQWSFYGGSRRLMMRWKCIPNEKLAGENYSRIFAEPMAHVVRKTAVHHTLWFSYHDL